MTTVDEAIATSTGRSLAVLQYSKTLKALVDSAKQPGFSVDSWDPLAQLIATDEFVRIGPFKEEMDWAQYTEFLTGWAKSSQWDCSVKRITEAANVVFLELEEHSEVGDFHTDVNTASVYEFTADNKIRHIAVYLQMQLPDPSMLPSFEPDSDSQ
ncbi:hypothetical protein AWC02_00535 [Mycolicibacter engbaekii]|uniref:SnoaL-like domain-containing protein n=1 Tax=Mycolicibacter engbaekii TaxID=188915 RepID=A0A1X1TQQ5_9MYCO|nr:hypothetical protein [Mycolicibacter engbaekii]ORV46900.1 hypothetical protein AWC02_00535 [Mycolicibacter engbaekii]